MNKQSYKSVIQVILAVGVGVTSYSDQSRAQSKPTEVIQVSSGSEIIIETDRENQEFLKGSKKDSHRGVASWYGGTGGGYTAAHKTLPLGSKVKVTNLKNGRSVVVRINDRGPFVRGRVIDLSPTAARAIGMSNSGLAEVSVQVLSSR